MLEHAGGDLPLRVPDAIAKLRGSDGEVVGAVGQQRHVRFRTMLGGRSAILRVNGNAAAFPPFVAVRSGLAPAAGEGFFDQVEALIEPIAADHAVVGKGPDAVNRIVRLNHVLAAHRERVDTQLAAQLIDGRLDGERRLGCAIATKGTGGDGVGVDRVTAPLLVLAAVGRDRRPER